MVLKRAGVTSCGESSHRLAVICKVIMIMFRLWDEETDKKKKPKKHKKETFKNTGKNGNSNYCLQGPGRGGISLNQECKWWSQPWMWRGCENKSVVGHFGPPQTECGLCSMVLQSCAHTCILLLWLLLFSLMTLNRVQLAVVCITCSLMRAVPGIQYMLNKHVSNRMLPEQEWAFLT